MKLSQFGVLALAAAATGITWVIAPNLVIRQGMLIAAFIGMLLFGLAVQAIYSRLRRPGIDAELWGTGESLARFGSLLGYWL